MTIRCKMSPIGGSGVVRMYTLTISPSVSGATVVLTATGYAQSGNSIKVPAGTPVSYSVSATHYQTKTGTQIVDSDMTLPVTLVLQQFTLTLSTNPAGATVSITANGTTTSGKTRVLNYNTSYTYTVSANGYTSDSGSGTLTANTTVPVTLNSTTLVNSTATGQKSFTVARTAKFEVTCVGGGAGGGRVYDIKGFYSTGSGGSGGKLKGTFTLPAGNYSYVVGSGGGHGSWNLVADTSPKSGSGGTTSISGPNSLSIYATGGSGCTGHINYMGYGYCDNGSNGSTGYSNVTRHSTSSYSGGYGAGGSGTGDGASGYLLIQMQSY